MIDINQALEDCLARMENGASLEDCVNRYPQHADTLRALLSTAARLHAARSIQTPAEFKHRGRTGLAAHMQAHPRRAERRSFFWARAAVALSVLTLAFLITGTGLAQSALPGEILYGWKLRSEQVWRVLTPDKLSADLTLADRRFAEILATPPSSEAQWIALQGYVEVLRRLAAYTDPMARAMIWAALQEHEAALEAAGAADLLEGFPQIEPTDTPEILPPLLPSATPGIPLTPPVLPAVDNTLLPVPTVSVP